MVRGQLLLWAGESKDSHALQHASAASPALSASNRNGSIVTDIKGNRRKLQHCKMLLIILNLIDQQFKPPLPYGSHFIVPAVASVCNSNTQNGPLSYQGNMVTHYACTLGFYKTRKKTKNHGNL